MRSSDSDFDGLTPTRLKEAQAANLATPTAGGLSKAFFPSATGKKESPTFLIRCESILS